MKKTLLLIIAAFLGIAACKDTGKQSAEQAASEQPMAKPVVYASNYPLYYFAKRIGGGQIDLHFPPAEMSDPSGWTPAADTVAAMQQADLILLNGASYEGWLMNVSLPDSLLVDTSESFTGQLLPSGETVTHSHGEEGEHAHEGTAYTTWLNLSLATKQANAVKEAMGRIRPDLKDAFEINYLEIAAELEELDNAFREVAAASPDTYLVFSHPVYQYFQDAYGLQGQSLHWEPETSMDHDRLHEIGHLKQDHNFRYLIWEGEPKTETMEELNTRGVQSVVLDPMSGTPASGDFIQGMRQNLKVLSEMLGQQP
ncbi:MAG: metal ABC transporter substrate-binding protein [Robiginitalea sp.]|jgi:zinc transport system substrate-binding protein